MIINKKKTINDPVLGFNTIESGLLFELIEHPYFQRLRRIKQLGLSCMVYPGANHTRFEHALGATFLMQEAIDTLRHKGVEITDAEAEAVKVAMLLHDIGHGPFSHALEYAIVENLVHEKISLLLMQRLNIEFNGKLSLAIQIFTNSYHKKFLHQLVSSQVDMDRLDYLRRDSFFSGVAEGTVGVDRIVKMMNVRNDNIVIEEKAIYSVEKFLIARRLMYWQVYLHKTVLSAEILLENTLKRAKEIALKGEKLYATPQLEICLSNRISFDNFNLKDKHLGCDMLDIFTAIDDDDIISSIKQWQNHKDYTLSYLARCIINRNLYEVKISNTPFCKKTMEKHSEDLLKKHNIGSEELGYFISERTFTNSAYVSGDNNIGILMKDGTVKELRDASDINLSNLTEQVCKYILCVAG